MILKTRKINPYISKNYHAKNGFILPIVIIVGLIIGAGLMALSARTFAGLMGSIRQGQSRKAREIAESGVTIIFITQGQSQKPGHENIHKNKKERSK